MRAGGEFPHLNRGDVQEWVREFLPCVPTVDVASLAGVGAGDPVTGEVNSLGISGIQIEAVGDDYHWLWRPPAQISTEAPVKIYAIWASSSTDTAEGATWKVLYNQDTFNSGAMAAAATALDTAIADDMCLGTAYVMQKTAAGLIDSAKIDPAKMMHILCELDAVVGTLNPAADTVFLLGIEIEYLRAKL